MPLNTHALQVPTAIGVGDAQPVKDLRDKCVAVTGTFSATVVIEVSLDGGTNYLAIGAGTAAPGLFQVAYPATHVRVRVTAFSSGAPKVQLAGYTDG